MIEKYQKSRLVGHISRDATAIEGRERAAKKVKKVKELPKPKGGRSKKDEAQGKPLTRLERQTSMSLAEMLADLPRVCDCGGKRNSKGYPTYWVGYAAICGWVSALPGPLPATGYG